MADFVREYGVATTITFGLYETDGVSVKTGATDGGSDVTIAKNEGTPATATNDFAEIGTTTGMYKLDLTATEMEAARVTITIVDQSGTKVFGDQVVVIDTHSHASAQTSALPANVLEIGGSTAVVAALKDLYESAVPGTVDNATFTATTYSWESDDLVVEEDDFYEHRICLFTSGNLDGQTRPINASGTANGKVKLFVVETDAFTVAPADNDTFRLLGFGK
jgi:hypothetical protein